MSAPPASTLAALLVAALVGATAGLGVFTFAYARGASYLTDDPAACGNCHVMNDQVSGWGASSHKNVAVCNDCHTPHDFVGKYTTKAINGWHHSYAFTTGDFHEPIRIGPRNLAITEAACRHCHAELTAQISHGDDVTGCVRCHRDVGHLH
ncbi:MAG: cytochrome c nitrite reductase small subunit [Myxococcota bacterium]